MLGPHSTYLASPDLLSMVGELRGEHDAILHIHASETVDEVDTVRAAHGALDRSLGGGAIGTGLAMRQHHCIAELNTRHAKQLRQLAATLPATPP